MGIFQMKIVDLEEILRYVSGMNISTKRWVFLNYEGETGLNVKEIKIKSSKFLMQITIPNRN